MKLIITKSDVLNLAELTTKFKPADNVSIDSKFSYTKMWNIQKLDTLKKEIAKESYSKEFADVYNSYMSGFETLRTSQDKKKKECQDNLNRAIDVSKVAKDDKAKEDVVKATEALELFKKECNTELEKYKEDNKGKEEKISEYNKSYTEKLKEKIEVEIRPYKLSKIPQHTSDPVNDNFIGLLQNLELIIDDTED